MGGNASGFWCPSSLGRSPTLLALLPSEGKEKIDDLVFAITFIGVLFVYSWFLALIVVATIPLYVIIAGLLSNNTAFILQGGLYRIDDCPSSTTVTGESPPRST